MKLDQNRKFAAARKMIKRAKRFSASAERSGISFAETARRYKKADALFHRAYLQLRINR